MFFIQDIFQVAHDNISNYNPVFHYFDPAYPNIQQVKRRINHKDLIYE